MSKTSITFHKVSKSRAGMGLRSRSRRMMMMTVAELGLAKIHFLLILEE